MDRRAEIDAAERRVTLRHLEEACLKLGGVYNPPSDNVSLRELQRILRDTLYTLAQKTALQSNNTLELNYERTN